MTSRHDIGKFERADFLLVSQQIRSFICRILAVADKQHPVKRLETLIDGPFTQPND